MREGANKGLLAGLRNGDWKDANHTDAIAAGTSEKQKQRWSEDCERYEELWRQSHRYVSHFQFGEIWLYLYISIS